MRSEPVAVSDANESDPRSTRIGDWREIVLIGCHDADLSSMSNRYEVNVDDI